MRVLLFVESLHDRHEELFEHVKQLILLQDKH
jgi:hypothetical protein